MKESDFVPISSSISGLILKARASNVKLVRNCEVYNNSKYCPSIGVAVIIISEDTYDPDYKYKICQHHAIFFSLGGYTIETL